MNTALPPTGLLCELLAYPERTQIRTPQPKFGWIVNDTAPNTHQVAFQILVATTLEKLTIDQADMWDSGHPDPGGVWQSDNRSLNIVYHGKPLESHTTYYWKVRTWHSPSNLSPWSEPQTFHTGELTDAYTTAWYPLETSEIKPNRVVQLAPDHVFIDFGKAAFGTLKLKLNSLKDCDIQIHLGEVPDGSHAIHRNPGGARRYQQLSLALQKGTHTYQLNIPSDPRNTKDFSISMPESLFEVYPFRYCEITGCPVPILRSNICQIAVHYRFTDGAVHFTSSNRVLNDVWNLCEYTMKATSFCGFYVDGDRERIPYEADAYINQLGHYCTDREFTMARRTHEYLIYTPTWPTEWILDSVLIAWNDYLYTGDVSSLKAHYTDLKAKALTALAREDGLISVNTGLVTNDILEDIHYKGKSYDHFKKGLIDNPDWPQAERDNYDMRPINTEVNAFHYRAVVLMARIAEALNKEDDIRWYRNRAESLKTTIQEKLIDPATGLMLDGEDSTHSSLHANMTAWPSTSFPSHISQTSWPS